MGKKIYAIVGSMGVGKTTVVEHLKKSVTSVTYLEEPVDIWRQVADPKTGENILNRMYHNPHRWAYTFENLAYVTRAKQLLDVLNRSDCDIIVIDGALALDKNAYAQKLRDEGKMDDIEWTAYNIWNSFCETLIRQHQITYLYLKCDPKKLYDRKVKRNRPEEADLGLDHFETLQRYIDQWITEHRQEHPNEVIHTFDLNCEDTSDQYRVILEQLAQLLKQMPTLNHTTTL
jgi:deoxyadenosine/deoxycytidine kinase